LKQGRTYIALVIALAIMGVSACASFVTKEQERWCYAWVTERAAARAAQDYPRLERLANQFIRDGKWLLDLGPENYEMYSEAYEDLIDVYFSRDDFMAALEASEKCIDVFYPNPSCHQSKVMALAALGRKPEARTACDIAERLVAHLIRVNERNLRQASQPIDKERYSNKLEGLKVRKFLLEGLRHLDFAVHFTH